MIITAKKNMLVGEFRFISEKPFPSENFKMTFLNVSYFDFQLSVKRFIIYIK